MAFQFSTEGAPYHQPVAPELPARVPIPQGDFVGSSIVGAFVHRAIAAEQDKIDQQRMLLGADLQAQHLAYQDKWQQQDHDIAQQNADSLAQYRQDEADWHLENKQERDAAVAAATSKKQQAEALAVQLADQVNTHDARATNYLTTHKTLNPERANTDPANVYLEIHDWDSKFGEAKIGAVPEMRKHLLAVADSMAVPYAPDAQYVTGKGETSVTTTGRFGGKVDLKPEQQLAWRVPGQRAGSWVAAPVIQVPIGTIAQRWQDPVNRPGIENAMIAAGHGKVVQQKDPDNPDNTIMVPTLDDYANRILSTFSKKRLDPESITPSALKSTPRKWMVNAGYGSQDADGTTGPTQDEIDYVRSNTNPAVRDRFLRTYGPGSEALLNQ